MCEILNASQNYAWSNQVDGDTIWQAVGKSWIDMGISTSVLNVLNCDAVRYQSEGAKKAGGHMSLELKKKTWVDCTR